MPLDGAFRTTIGRWPRSRLPRWAWLAALCVALGLVTSVGVAWGLTYLVNGELPVGTVTTQARLPGTIVGTDVGVWIKVSACERPPVSWKRFWPQPFRSPNGPDVPPQWPSKVDLGVLTTSPHCRSALERHLPLMLTRDGMYVEFTVAEVGWPWCCVAIEDACTADDVRRAKSRAHVFDYVTQSFHSPEKNPSVDAAFTLWPIYFHPLWPGLLANIALYASAWALLITTTRRSIRWFSERRHARRGGCPQCGYCREGLKEGASCPECGRATPAAHDATPTPAAPKAR